MTTLQEELIRAEVFPLDYDFEVYKELVAMQPGGVPVIYADNLLYWRGVLDSNRVQVL